MTHNSESLHATSSTSIHLSCQSRLFSKISFLRYGVKFILQGLRLRPLSRTKCTQFLSAFGRFFFVAVNIETTVRRAIRRIPLGPKFAFTENSFTGARYLPKLMLRLSTQKIKPMHMQAASVPHNGGNAAVACPGKHDSSPPHPQRQAPLRSKRFCISTQIGIRGNRVYECDPCCEPQHPNKKTQVIAERPSSITHGTRT